MMRCLTLASALRRRGAVVRFLCRELPEGLASRIAADYNFELGRLPPPSAEGFLDAGPALAHAQWLPVSQQRDATDVLESMNGQASPDWMVVDHYALDRRWEARLRPYVRRILAIDDLADRSHDCDILLDQNLFLSSGNRYAGRVPPACGVLLGPRYALLRPEFAAARAALAARSGELRRILVFFGSFDPSNQTLKALRAISAAGIGEIGVDVVIGENSLYRSQIEDHCRRTPSHSLHIQAEGMAALMARADLAVGAAGATTWERCCLGLPALVITIAENQIEIARGCDRAGAVKYLGHGDAVLEHDLAIALRNLAGSPSRLAQMSRRAMDLVDGLGADRVCDGLLN